MRKLSMYGPSLVVLATAAIVLLAGPNAVYRLTHKQTVTRAMLASESLQGDTILAEMNQAYQDIAAAVEPSVVHISAERAFTHPVLGSRTSSVSSGSGWIYDEEGHIVTNHHVVEDAVRIEVQLYSGERRDAEIIGFDRSTDIAVLKIPPGRLYPATRSESRRQVQRGEMVFAFGSPLDFRFSMSSGVVSGTGRTVGVIRDQWGNRNGSEYFIQVDAAINPGNSGGPLTDVQGRVIGMNTAIATDSRERSNDQGRFSGIGLAIPIDMIEPVVSQIISTGVVRKGYLGVHVANREDSIAGEYNVLGYRVVDGGIVVARIPEEHRELRRLIAVGDVITHIGGLQIASPEQVPFAFENFDSGRPVPLALWRYDERSQRAERPRVTLQSKELREQFLDTEFLSMADEVGDRLDLLGFIGQGVTVIVADVGEPARSAGVTRGDVITHVNGKPVAEVRQLQSIIAALQPDEIAELQIWRYDDDLALGQTITVEVPLGQLDRLRTHGELEPSPVRDSIPGLGIQRMATMTPELAEQFEVEYRPGVMLLEFVSGSRLDRQFEPGTIVIAVMDRPVADIAQFLNALSATDLRNGAKVTVIHPDGNFDGTELTIINN